MKESDTCDFKSLQLILYVHAATGDMVGRSAVGLSDADILGNVKVTQADSLPLYFE